MKNSKGSIKTIVTAFLTGVLMLSSITGYAGEPSVQQTQDSAVVQHGKCSMQFPGDIERVSESMQVDGEEYALQYDAYISSLDAKTVFMLLVAEYPAFVDEQLARMNLEAFLNVILTYNPNNQLLFADIILVQGHEALDFFIRSGAMYFKGRALMVNNQLYLMAMECQIPDYD
ncbi:MAG: hypothetical protein FJZ58_06040, partial [Chlamydiae bacterium]|nr:hypothetical protein [Chlamydiota bacterium]